MSEFIDNFIKKNKVQFLKYRTYLETNNWTDMSLEGQLTDSFFNDIYSDNPTNVRKAEITKLIKEQISSQKDAIKTKAEEFKLQNDLITNILDRVKYFVNKTAGEHHLKKFKSFVKESLDIVQIHMDRVDDYLASVDVTKIQNQEVRSEEIKLTKDCFSSITKIQETITNLNIKEEQATEGIQWLDKQKATVAMIDTLIGGEKPMYPEIKIKLDAMGIDLVSPPPNTIHILNENPPEYNSNKNFWEQDKDTLQYYVDEYKKIERGITIDGYFIDGWLYFHFNYFVTNIPTTIEHNGVKENKDVTKIPDLRDNEIVMTDYFQKSRKEQTMSVIAASRRLAKTTLNSSRLFRAMILNKKQILCAGGSSEDLNHIHNNIDTCYNNINSAFKLYYLAPTEDGRGKAYGIKTKDNKSKVTSNLFIINLEGGSKKGKKESLAGFTPDEFILDEALKFHYKEQLLALESALWGSGILRCSVLITGTGGDDQLAKDGITMLNNPEGNRVTQMDWNNFEKNVPEDCITWKRRKFGLFMPTQMCVKHKKVKSNLADYLGIKSETLKKVTLWVTDWKSSKEAEEKERAHKQKEGKAEYIRYLAYHPFDPDEIFLSGNTNPYPVEELKKRKQELIESGDLGKKVILTQDSTGKVSYELSNKDIAKYPHNGGFIDAPVVLYQELPEIKPPQYLYVAGFDDYKQEESDTDSIGSFYIYRVNVGEDIWKGRIVASLATRPDPHLKLYRQIYLLQQAFNAICFMENADDGYKQYLERKRVADMWLQTSLDFKAESTQASTNKRKYGWTPTKENIRYLKNLTIQYTKEEFTYTNEDGVEITITGAQKINDIELLQEMIDYRDDNNVDRITAFGSCLGLEFHYYTNWMLPKIDKKEKREEEKPKKQERTMIDRMYGSGTRKKRFF